MLFFSYADGPAATAALRAARASMSAAREPVAVVLVDQDNVL